MKPLGSLGTAAAVVFAVALSAGCSSGNGSGSSSTTTTPTTLMSTSPTSKHAPSTSSPSKAPTSTAPGSVSPTTGGSTNTTAAAPPTTGGGPASTVHITNFQSKPASPVSCNAPTQIELSWTTSGATKVTLSLDGRVFATYGPGPQDHLEYFACDGRPHTYTLRAEGGGQSATATKVITSR